MTTQQLRKVAMNLMHCKYSDIQPIAHFIGMDYPKGFHVKKGKCIFEPHRNYFYGFDYDFQEERKQGWVEVVKQEGRNCYFRLTNKGKNFLEQFFCVKIVGDWFREIEE